SNFKVIADESQTKDINQTLTVKGETNNTHQNIKTKASDNNLTIALNSELKGISSIAKSDKSKISFNDENITFTAGESTNNVTLKDGNFSGVSSIGKDNKAKISFNNTSSNEDITFNVGDSTFKFNKDGLDLGNKQIKNVASGIGGTATSNIDNVLTGTSIDSIKNNVVNVEDLSNVAKAVVGKGLKFKGNSGSDINASLGDTIKIIGDGVDLNSTIS
ncbi:hypothetical protein, partial [Campylobacter portucalensis]|uniref:hypothetical protein n=1 Tax=Campylobacter portucalensis TaxID=2608384 RepID=UPI0018A6ACFF